jgi:hypothetical protein
MDDDIASTHPHSESARTVNATGDEPHVHRAAHHAVEQTSAHVTLPLIGCVTLPPPQHMAWYAGVGALAVLEIIDWPIAVVLAIGKALADDRGNRTVEAFGRALDEAA